MKPSENGEEVAALFEEKSSAWAGKYAPGGPLHERLLCFDRALHERLPTPAKLLELGCGTGNLAAYLVQNGYVLTAADVSAGMLSRARTLFGKAGVTWELLPPDWTDLPWPDGAFDGALASSLLEYVTDVGQVLAELKRVVRPGGWLVVSVPNTDHPMRQLEALASDALRTVPLLRDVAERLPRVAPFARYLGLSRNRFVLESWRARFMRAGFEVSLPVGRLGALWLLAAQRTATR